MTLAEIVRETRRGAGLFDMSHRGLIEVRGEDRVRWLDGMISGDVQALEKEGDGSGCYATLLTNRGAIVADFHVGRIDDVFYLESLRSKTPKVLETLNRYIIADDVELEDQSDAWVCCGLEGPRSRDLLEAAAGHPLPALGAERWARMSIAGREVLVGAFGFSGERAFQIRMRADEQTTIEAAIADAANSDSLVHGTFEALEILRVEAGIAALGAELDEDVLPPEARLDHAISTTKGCYVGQEIVARLRARGKVNHLLVGLRLDAPELPAVDAILSCDGRATGELTSVVSSPTQGAIALGYVRREHSDVGTNVEFEGGRATIAELPFVALDAGYGSMGESRPS